MILQKTTKVVVVSEQAIYLRGLASMVLSCPSLQLAGQGSSSADAAQLCQMLEPDLIIIDLKNEAEGGLSTVRRLHQDWPEMKILLLMGQGDESHSPEDLDEIPLFYLSRDMSEEEFRAAVAHIRHEAALPDPGQMRGEEEIQAEARAVVRRSPEPTTAEVMSRELVMAGKIQADILPEEAPIIAGWDIAAKLEPARETSGDFYDFIPMGGRKWGIVVADVTDKGMGAALFMALSSSLIRTYATRFPTLPAVAVNAVNDRILTDTRGGMFVTAFYGVLEPYTGRVIFANAGHPPAYLISTRRGRESVDSLRPTGMALGVDENTHWKQKMVKMMPGDYLILYTDGITEAQNPHGAVFGEDRLVESVLSRPGRTAREVLNTLLSEVHQFVGNTPRQDDIALIVIRRED